MNFREVLEWVSMPSTWGGIAQRISASHAEKRCNTLRYCTLLLGMTISP